MAKAPRKRSTLESKLQTALNVASAAKEELAVAEAKLRPLRKLASKAVANATKLLHKYSAMAGLTSAPGKRGRRKGRKMSAATRAKMAAAQKKRWAAKKA